MWLLDTTPLLRSSLVLPRSPWRNRQRRRTCKTFARAQHPSTVWYSPMAGTLNSWLVWTDIFDAEKITKSPCVFFPCCFSVGFKHCWLWPTGMSWLRYHSTDKGTFMTSQAARIAKTYMYVMSTLHLRWSVWWKYRINGLAFCWCTVHCLLLVLPQAPRNPCSGYMSTAPQLFSVLLGGLEWLRTNDWWWSIDCYCNMVDTDRLIDLFFFRVPTTDDEYLLVRVDN